MAWGLYRVFKGGSLAVMWRQALIVYNLLRCKVANQTCRLSMAWPMQRCQGGAASIRPGSPCGGVIEQAGRPGGHTCLPERAWLPVTH